jgi:hypothetical protein
MQLKSNKAVSSWDNMGISCFVEMFRSEGVQTGGSRRFTILIAYYLMFDNVKQRYRLEGLGVGGKIILKWISNK